MIDTIVLIAQSSNYIFPKNQAKFLLEYSDRQVPRSYWMTEAYISQDKKIRVFHDINREQIRLECSIPKLIFGNNSINYIERTNVASALELIKILIKQFFKQYKEVYINRIDISAMQEYESIDEKRLHLEAYRVNKPINVRLKKFTHQNYADSIFYYSKNYSIKIYDKHKETPINDCYLDNSKMLRFEKSYRRGEMQKLKLLTYPFLGCKIGDFDLNVLVNDFERVFTNWEMKKQVIDCPKKGLLGVIKVLKFENPELYRQIISSGKISDSTIKRTNKVESKIIDTKCFEYVVNIHDYFKNKLSYVLLNRRFEINY